MKKPAHLEKLENGKYRLTGEGDIWIEEGSKRACMIAVKRFGMRLVDKYDLNAYLRDTD